MSASASRAQALASPLPLPPMMQVSVAATSPSTAAGPTARTSADVAGLLGSSVAGTAPADAAVPAPKAEPKKTAAQAFAQAPGAPDAAAGATVATTTAASPSPSPASTAVAVVAGRPGTVATTTKPAMPTQSPATAGSIGGAVVALVLVVGLILALGWIARRLPGFRGAGNASALRVVGSLSLGPRERVVVVAVGDTQLLIGVGAGGMRTLHTLEQPLPAAAPAATPAFAQLLSQHFGKKA